MENRDTKEEKDEPKFQVIFTRTQIKMRGIITIPPQPLWFPDSYNLRPLSKAQKEGLRFIDNVREGAIIGFAANWRGSPDTATFKAFSKYQIVNYIINPASIPAEEASIFQVYKGEFFPFNLPDISDLSLHPKVVRIYLEWELKRSSYEDLNGIISKLLWETATEMLTRRETWYMEGGRSNVDIRSFGNYFKDVRVDAICVKKILVKMVFKRTTTDHRDGRTTELSIEALKGEAIDVKRRRVMDSIIRKLLIWNCRGVCSWGFETALHLLDLCHKPEYILLLETRVTCSLMKKVVCQFGWKVVGWSTPVGGTQGVALLTRKGAISNETNTPSTWEFTIEMGF